MKPITKVLLLIAIVGCLAACKKDENSKSLIGTWRHVTSSYGTGFEYVTAPAKNKNGYITFYSDGKLKSNVMLEYVRYSITDSVKVAFFKADSTLQNYRYIIRGDSLSMSPAGPIVCFEGCSTTFKR